jgi:signal transduction histidine kinase
MNAMPDLLTGEPLRHFRHELRTPLNHIVGFADILIDDAEDGGRTQLVPRLREIRAGGMALLDAMQTALPGEMLSVDRVQLERVAEALSPRISHIGALCAALEKSGVYGEGGEALEHLQTISWALDRMAAILSDGVKGFA